MDHALSTNCAHVDVKIIRSLQEEPQKSSLPWEPYGRVIGTLVGVGSEAYF